MPEQLKTILDKILEWWKKFNTKQRVLIGSAVAVVVIALVILTMVMTTPKMELLHTCKDYTEAAKIKEILATDETINYEFYESDMSFHVEESDLTTASMLLGSNQVELSTYSISNVVDGSFTRTEADKQRLYKDYLEKKFADQLSQMPMVESCNINLELPQDDGTILSREQSASASVQLFLNSDIDSDQAYGIALFVATQLGNDTTEGITIMDQNCYILYSGADSQTSMGIASTQLTFKEKLENAIRNEVRNVLVGSKVFADVQVGLNVDVDFDSSEIVKTEITNPQGMDGGAITQQSLYDYVSTMGDEGGVPGTDTNDDTTYVIEDDQYGKTEISESDTTYDYDRMVTTIRGNGGDIEYNSSSASVMATKYISYHEEEVRASGALEDMTWEEFKAANSETRVVEVDEQYIQLVANTTGFPANKISFLCYEEPKFFDAVEEEINIMDYAQIALAVLIFALLGFVVFRSTRSQKEEEPVPEISVESLLESTVESQEELEDIGLNEKSEVRVLIEKFVDENPEAVASLLRNWLNEDWE
ncbi:MAG: flagellar M-ring protein FliF [Agathobacter sp.]|nr:flagellar M-ring protein FliF [Agathobacter sp.]